MYSRNCTECPTVFESRSQRASYCSEDCRKASVKRKRDVTVRSGRKSVGKQDLECVVCSKSFQHHLTHTKTCSKECRDIKTKRDSKVRYVDNSEALKEKSKNYYYLNRDSKIEYARKYASEHREESNQYKYRCADKRKRLTSGKSIPYSLEQLNARWEYFGNKCYLCGEAGTLTKDHVKPISKGGWDCLSNLRPAHQSCNSKKNSKWKEEVF